MRRFMLLLAVMFGACDQEQRAKTLELEVRLDVQPHIPDGWSIRPDDQIASRVQGGWIELIPVKVELYLAEAQKTGRIVGTELRKQLEGKPVLPAQVLDHLLANTGRIPDSWKQDEQGNTPFIYFWGTVYRDHDGLLCVRFLYWGGGRWHWDYSYPTNVFDSQSLAAVLAR